MSILIEKLNITIDGVNYDSQYIYSDIKLTQELMKPNELRFHMTKNTLAEDESDLKIDISRSLLGKEIKFSMTTFRDEESKSGKNDALKFSGIVFGVRAVRKHMGSGLILEVTAYSHDYLLMDNAHCNSYENTALSSIVSDVVSEYGNIPMSVSPVMTEDIPYVVQYNETSYGFLSRLAQRYGEWFYNSGSKLIFGQLEKLDKVDLTPGFDILNYEYKVSMKHSKITHARHNYLDYQNTQASAPGSGGGGGHRLAGIASGASDTVYQKTTFRNYHSSLAEESSLDEVEHSAKAQGMGKQAGTMKCYGSSNRCDLQIGSIIRIKEYFDPGTGNEEEFVHDELLICGITHHAGNDGSYQNEFLAIDPAAEYPPYAFGDCYPHTETQRALVKDNKDPEHLGRIRVQFLWQQEQDDSQMSPWIRIAQPHGGGDKGFYFIPEVDEEVVVGFENGNAEKPYVIGTLYHGQAKPSGSWYDEEDNIKAIRTRSGHTLEFHDTMGNEYMKIYDNQKDNFVLTFSSVERLIRLQSKGNIELYADKDIIIDAKENIKINAGANIEETSGKDTTQTAGENRFIKATKNIEETSGEDNLITIGKNRTIKTTNNINEESGDDINIKVGKNRVIDVGNDISEKAGDNISIDVGKNRTIKVGNDIEETAGANITIKAESNISESAGKDISENAGSNVKIEAGDNVEASAGKNMGLSATDSISASAKKDFSALAGKDITMSANDDTSVRSGKDMNISSEAGMGVSSNKTMKIHVGENMLNQVAKKFNLNADNIEQSSDKSTTISAGSKLKQNASSGMDLSGGSIMNIKATNVKIN